MICIGFVRDLIYDLSFKTFVVSGPGLYHAGVPSLPLCKQNTCQSEYGRVCERLSLVVTFSNDFIKVFLA